MTARPLIKIAITAPEPAPDEARRIMALLDAGWHMVHMRHPDATLRRMRAIIESVPQHYHGRLRLHGHFGLLSEFNLGGIHLNSRCPEPPALYTGPMSRSCHSVDEALQAAASGHYDYVWLSPVADSISKPGYQAAFTPAELSRLSDAESSPIVALGGVTPAIVPRLMATGFGGIAVLGYLMQCCPEQFAERLTQF